MTNNSKPEDKSNNNIFFPTSNQTILNNPQSPIPMKYSYNNLINLIMLFNLHKLN